MRSRMAAALLGLSLALGTAACSGEPPVPLEVPQRGANQVFLDRAGILDEGQLAPLVNEFRHRGWDPVLVTFETEDASLGMADRAGRKVIEAWGADLAIVAVAAPGDFDSDAPDRRRYFGLFARNVRDIPRAARERIVEELIPPIAAANRWDDVFATAVRELGHELGEVDEDIR